MVIPKNNINLATNVRDALLTGGGSVNNNAISFFKEAAKINPWNKYKPTDVGGDFPEYPGTYWKGKDEDCMMVIKTVSDLSALENLYLTGDTGWVYKTFDASGSTPYRLGDFRGYDTDASSCISSIQYADTIEVTTSDENNKNLWLTPLYKTQQSHELNFSDIWNKTTYTYMNNWYAGFVYKSTNSSQLKIITQSSPIDYADINETILLKVGYADRGTFTIYPVMSQHSYIEPTTVLHPSSYICPLPNSNTINIKVQVIVPYTISLDTVQTTVTVLNSRMQAHIYFKVKSSQNVELKGQWYYTAIGDGEGRPLGATVVDPKFPNGYTISTGNSNVEYTTDFIGTQMYIEGLDNDLFEGVLIQFIAEGVDGASFGGHVYNIER